MKPEIAFGIFSVFTVVIISFLWIYGYADDEAQTSEPLEVNAEYAPSVNLAILEGRFDDARESINRIDSLGTKQKR